jgi:hypothetical protein
MDDEPPESWTATETLLIALGEELDAALEMSTSRRAEALFAEIADRCRRGAILAEAGRLLVARPD